MAALFLFSAFVISTCGLVYELVNGALASYLLGDSVTQFSLVIGVYLFAMGVGSFLTKYLRGQLLATFVRIEILVGIVGGFSSTILMVSFAHVASFRLLLYLLVIVTGTLVGAEIPLLMRLLKNQFEFKDLVAKVFTFDYVGALIASILFPLVLMPKLGMLRTGLLFGIANVLVALFSLGVLEKNRRIRSQHYFFGTLALIALVVGFALSDKFEAFAEAGIFPGQTIFSKTTAYQRILITQQENDIRLYLNNHLQFSSRDEYRYHEALVYPGLYSIDSPHRVLVLGGGDGMAVREILKNSAVTEITLVDLDRAMTRTFKELDLLRRLNGDSLNNLKVKVINEDAFIWLKSYQGPKFDFIVLDFPDPANYSIGKLYTLSYFRLLQGAIRPEGNLVVQSTSPLAARKSFWCVYHTLQAAGFTHLVPYHLYIPSFGDWGFVLARNSSLVPAKDYGKVARFINPDEFQVMQHFSADTSEVPTEVNRLSNQNLVRYYEAEWNEYLIN